MTSPLSSTCIDACWHCAGSGKSDIEWDGRCLTCKGTGLVEDERDFRDVEDDDWDDEEPAHTYANEGAIRATPQGLADMKELFAMLDAQTKARAATDAERFAEAFADCVAAGSPVEEMDGIQQMLCVRPSEHTRGAIMIPIGGRAKLDALIEKINAARKS